MGNYYYDSRLPMYLISITVIAITFNRLWMVCYNTEIPKNLIWFDLGDLRGNCSHFFIFAWANAYSKPRAPLGESRPIF